MNNSVHFFVTKFSFQQTNHWYSLFENAFNESQEAASILVWLYGGYLGSSTVLHSLGCISCALLHAVASQDVNNSQKVDFHLWTLYKHSRPDEINEDQYYILKVGFQYNLRKLTSECPTVLDFAAAGNDEGGGGASGNNKNSTRKVPVKSPTNTQLFTGQMHFVSPNQQCQSAWLVLVPISNN